MARSNFLIIFPSLFHLDGWVYWMELTVVANDAEFPLVFKMTQIGNISGSYSQLPSVRMKNATKEREETRI